MVASELGRVRRLVRNLHELVVVVQPLLVLVVVVDRKPTLNLAVVKKSWYGWHSEVVSILYSRP